MNEKFIVSPIPGTFYRRPSPDSPMFVDEGDVVQPDTVVAVVELMKQFSQIPAGLAGKIGRFLVEDGEPVDSDQMIASVITE